MHTPIVRARIGIDSLTARAHAPGAGRYARELIRALAPLCAPGELALYEVGRAPRCMPPESLGAGAHLPTLRSARPRSLARWWPGWRYADRELGGVHIFHQTAPVPLPLRVALETRACAEFSGLPPPASLAALFVFSASLRTALIEAGALPAARIHLVPVGAEHWSRELKEHPPAPARPRIGLLGRESPEDERPRWRAMAARLGWELVELGPQTREAELPAAVAGLSALLHLSSRHGTPVTALECLSLGVPVLTRDLEVFRSALGSLLLPVDPKDSAAVERNLRRAIAQRADPDWQAAARAQAAPFTWASCARAHLEVWRSL
ncbi:MAG: hypothetical protein RL277_211 [Planctomycetota bacterium]